VAIAACKVYQEKPDPSRGGGGALEAQRCALLPLLGASVPIEIIRKANERPASPCASRSNSPLLLRFPPLSIR
jgi:hypothetical protein